MGRGGGLTLRWLTGTSWGGDTGTPGEKGEVKWMEIECLLRALNEPEGEVFLPNGSAGGLVEYPDSTDSSGIVNSASVMIALNLLLVGTTVCVECKDSAMDTGRGVRVPLVVADLGRTV